MQCFWDLFRQKGIDKITVSELSEMAQINRSTFYVYFKDVYDVLDQIEQCYLPDGVKLFEQFKDLKDKDLIYQKFLTMFDASYLEIAFLLSEHGDPNFVLKLKNSLRPVFRQSMLKQYQTHKNFDLTVEFILSSMIGVITYWANHTNEISSKELFDHLHSLYIYGVPYSLGATNVREKEMCPPS